MFTDFQAGTPFQDGAEILNNEINVGQVEPRNQRERIRELLKHALDMTYNLPPDNDYSHILNQYSETNKLMESFLERSNDHIHLLQPKKKKMLLKRTFSAQEEEILPPVKKKNKYVGRVGETAELFRSATSLKVNCENE